MVGMIILFAAICISGCIKTDNLHDQIITVTGDIDKIEITDYSVTTIWSLSDNWDDETLNNHSGFYHEYPDGIYDAIYDLKGTIKNIANSNLDEIRIIVLFCDVYNNEISRETDIIYNLSTQSTEVFRVYITAIETLNFDDVDIVKFEVSVL